MPPLPFDRFVTLIDPHARPGRDDVPPEPVPFSSLAAEPALILIGDAGAGKSTVLELAAQADPAALMLPVKKFLMTPEARLRGVGTLFLDGLDEHRAAGNADEKIERLVAKLAAIAPQRFRIACRAADWLGILDREAFSVVLDGSAPIVARLEPPTDDEIAALVRHFGLDPDPFLREVEVRGLRSLTRNPETLRLLCTVVRERGAWPNTLLEVYGLAVDELARESNRHHRGGIGSVGPALLVDAAGAACAALLISDEAHIDLAGEDEGAPRPAAFPADPVLVDQVARTRLFEAVGEGIVAPAHRTISEFLAGRWLAKRMKEGLPLSRILALVTGADEGIVSEMRGLVAWLACHSGSRAAEIVGRDPMGVIRYGDARALDGAARQALVSGLRTLAEEYPRFRDDDWSEKGLGALCGADTTPAFAEILGDPSSPFSLTITILQAIVSGDPQPELASTLEALVRNDERSYAERELATTALFQSATGGNDRADSLWAELGAEGGVDALRLRLHLLRLRYGNAPPREAILDLLASVDDSVERPTTYIGLLWPLARRLELDLIPALLRSAAERHDQELAGKPKMVAEFFARLVDRALEAGYEPSATDVRGWLKLAAADRVRSDPPPALVRYLREHSECLAPVVEAEFDVLEGSHLSLADHVLSRRLGLSAEIIRPLLYELVLVRARAEPDETRAGELFTLATRLSLYDQNHNRFDEVAAASSERDAFATAFTAATACPVSPEDLERAAQRRLEERRRRRELDQFRERFAAAIDAVREGRHLDLLYEAAHVVLDMHPLRQASGDEQLSTAEDRLTAVFGEELTPSVREGMTASISALPLHTPAELGDLRARNWGAPEAVIIAAVVDLTPAPVLDGLDPDRLGRLLVHVLDAVGYGDDENGGAWLAAIASAAPDATRQALVDYVAPQLDAGTDHVSGLAELADGSAFEAVAGDVARALLEGRHRPAMGALERLLAALLGRKADDAEGLVARALADDSLPVEQRVAWLAAMWVLDRSRQDELLTRLRGQPQLTETVLGLLGPHVDSAGAHAISTGDVDTLSFLITLCGQSSLPSDRLTRRAATLVGELLTLLALRKSAAAQAALTRLVEDERLADWRAEILHARALQARAARDAAYTRPSIAEAVETLRSGKPASVRDLHALLVDQLRDLAAGIRHSQDDLYKQFWNVDQYGRPRDPRPEETCRDLLVRVLAPRFDPLGIILKPEGHMADDKRVDIETLDGRLMVPTEIKRSMHGEFGPLSSVSCCRAMPTMSVRRGTGSTWFFGSGTMEIFG